MNEKNITKKSINFFLEEALFNFSLTGRIHALNHLVGDLNPDAGWLVITLIQSGLILKEREKTKD